MQVIQMCPVERLVDESVEPRVLASQPVGYSDWNHWCLGKRGANAIPELVNQSRRTTTVEAAAVQKEQ